MLKRFISFLKNRWIYGSFTGVETPVYIQTFRISLYMNDEKSKTLYITDSWSRSTDYGS